LTIVKDLGALGCNVLRCELRIPLKGQLVLGDQSESKELYLIIGLDSTTVGEADASEVLARFFPKLFRFFKTS